MASIQLSRRLMKAALDSADPIKSLRTNVLVRNQALVVNGLEIIPDLSKFKRTVLVGAGKCSAEMASVLTTLPLPNIVGGMIITKDGHGGAVKNDLVKHNVKVLEASHPIPDQRSGEAVTSLLQTLQRYDSADSLIIWLASGGGSALTAGLGVNDELKLPQIQETVDYLLRSGAPIEDVNAIRKHLCLIHGGKISNYVRASLVVTLVVSDIIGSPLHSIAGGPTTADPSTIADCQDILTDLARSMPTLAIPKTLHDAFFAPSHQVLETPKILPRNFLPGIVVTDLKKALDGAADLALAEKLTVMVMSSTINGEAKEVARVLSSIASDIPLPPPFVLLFGGETTVTIDPQSTGKGGRNQELALAAAIELYTKSTDSDVDIAIMSIGSDGTDGPTDAAGAVVDKTTITNRNQLKAAKLALQNHDSYHFFQQHCPDSHIIIGPTGNNVADMMIVCCQKLARGASSKRAKIVT